MFQFAFKPLLKYELLPFSCLKIYYINSYISNFINANIKVIQKNPGNYINK